MGYMGIFYKMPKAIFYLLQWDYRVQQGFWFYRGSRSFGGSGMRSVGSDVPFAY